jgi:hypothetical protein
LPAFLSVNVSVFDRKAERIEKCLRGFLEAEAMLPLIRDVLGFISLKANASHKLSVITNLQVFNRASLRLPRYAHLMDSGVCT